MRKLKSTDAFAFMRIVKESGTRDEFRRIVSTINVGVGVNIEDLGIEWFLGVIEGLSNKSAEKSFFEFASGILEYSVDELMDMDLIDFIELVKSYGEVEDKERWKAFFDAVAGLMK